MKSHEIEPLECTSAVSVLLGLIGRVFFFFFYETPSLADKRVLASDPEQLPSIQGLGWWNGPAGAAAAAAVKEKNKAATSAGVATPTVNVFWRVGVSRNTCQPAECFPRELVRGENFRILCQK